MPRFIPLADPRPDDTPWPQMVWPPAGLPLTGQTVELSPIRPEEDAPELFAALDDDRVWAHLPLRPADPGAFTRMLLDQRVAGRFGWTVRLAETRAIVGTTSFLDASTRDARLEIGSTVYAASVWGGRVNPETKYLLLRLAFETLHVGRVQLKTDVRNVRSQQAIARLGATYEGVLRRYQRRADGTVRDTVLFSLTAEDWPGARDGLLARLGA